MECTVKQSYNADDSTVYDASVNTSTLFRSDGEGGGAYTGGAYTGGVEDS